MSKLNLKEALKNDVAVSYDERKNGGVSGERYLDMSKPGCSYFKIVKGKNAMDIIPFIYGTDLFTKKGKRKGDPGAILAIYIHKNFNNQFDKCICMRHTFGKSCPICDERQRLKDLPDADEYEKRIDSLKAKRRCIMNVINLKPDEEDEYGGQVQVFDDVHYFFAKELLEEASANSEEGGDPVDFYTPDEGMTVLFRASAEKIGSGSYFKFKSFSFEEREEAYDEEIINEDYSDDVLEHGAYSLDTLLKFHTHEEIMAMLHETAIDNDEDEEEEKEEPPAPKRGKAKKKVEVEEEEEEEEEKPKKPAKAKKEEPEDDGETCPYGHEFGVDTLSKDECQGECRKKHLSTFKQCVAKNMN